MAILTKKQRLEQRIVINGQFKFCGKTFNCPQVSEKTSVLVAFDSFRDNELSLFDQAGNELGLAHWIGLEVSHG